MPPKSLFFQNYAMHFETNIFFHFSKPLNKIIEVFAILSFVLFSLARNSSNLFP